MNMNTDEYVQALFLAVDGAIRDMQDGNVGIATTPRGRSWQPGSRQIDFDMASRTMNRGGVTRSHFEHLARAVGAHNIASILTLVMRGAGVLTNQNITTRDIESITRARFTDRVRTYYTDEPDITHILASVIAPFDRSMATPVCMERRSGYVYWRTDRSSCEFVVTFVVIAYLITAINDEKTHWIRVDPDARRLLTDFLVALLLGDARAVEDVKGGHISSPLPLTEDAETNDLKVVHNLAAGGNLVALSQLPTMLQMAVAHCEVVFSVLGQQLVILEADQQPFVEAADGTFILYSSKGAARQMYQRSLANNAEQRRQAVVTEASAIIGQRNAEIAQQNAEIAQQNAEIERLRALLNQACVQDNNDDNGAAPSA